MDTEFLPLVTCPKHPDAELGQSEEHVFCLVDGCDWSEELCWKDSSGTTSFHLVHCQLVSGHEGFHRALDSDSRQIVWENSGSLRPNSRLPLQPFSSHFVSSVQIGAPPTALCQVCGKDIGTCRHTNPYDRFCNVCEKMLPKGSSRNETLCATCKKEKELRVQLDVEHLQELARLGISQKKLDEAYMHMATYWEKQCCAFPPKKNIITLTTLFDADEAWTKTRNDPHKQGADK